MLKLEVNENQFSLYFKNYHLFKHSPELPLISIGYGQNSFKEKHSVYKFKDQVIKKADLINFEVKENTDSKIKIHLSSENGKVKLELNISIEEENLKLTPEILEKDGPEPINRFWFQMNADPEEAVYGCGEQFSELNLRGLNVPLWVSEQGIGRTVGIKKQGSKLYLKKRKFPFLTQLKDRIITSVLNLAAGVGGSWYTTYYPQPTFVSSNNLFCHVEGSAYSEFNFKNAHSHRIYFWEVPKEIIIGKFQTALETVGSLSKVLGIQPKLPDWTYDGMWLAIQGEGGKEKVIERLEKALDAGVKVSAIWSQDWEGIYETSFGTQLFWDWKWNGGGREVRFENFPQFVDHVREKYGIRYMGYINSFLNKGGDLYKEAKEKGYLIEKVNGEEYNVVITTFPVPIIDLTNPEAFEWIKDVMKKYMIEEAHLNGWMSDFGEAVNPDAKLHSHESAWTYHNRYPVEWQRANYEAIKEAGKLGEVVYFTRSGYSHTSRYSTCIWAGDQLVNWGRDDGLPSVIPAGLSLSMCGIGYHQSDIGGYTTFKPVFTRNSELFMRWAEQTAFTMVMRSHESNQPENNVQFDSNERVLEHLGKMTQIHVHLKPYLQKISEEYQEKGIPPMRPLYLHYEEDPEVHSIQYEYLLGKDLLVAPVIEKGKSEWDVYIPHNTHKKESWVHIWTDKKYESGWHTVMAPLGKPPVFYRCECEDKELFEGIKEI